MSCAVGITYASAVFLLLQRSLLQILLGLALLGYATNLLILVAAGLRGESAPLIKEGFTTLASTSVDPLPQAFILTAIVIGFALLGFTLALAYRCISILGHDDVDKLTNTDRIDPPATVPRENKT